MLALFFMTVQYAADTLQTKAMNMEMNPVLENLPDYPFDRLRQLLSGISPATDAAPLVLSIGEPQHAPPVILQQTVEENSHLWGKYPPIDGTPEFRNAVVNWLNRRYGLKNLLDADANVLPVIGTREALYLITTVAVSENSDGSKPIVVMPNPLYHVYGAAAAVSGAEPLYLTATAENNFMTDISALDDNTLSRVKLFYLCSPSNPAGMIAPMEMLKTAIRLARKHGFLLVADECYQDIYGDKKPPGILEACQELGGGLENVLTFQSLSKRSSAPGLRSGFVAGDGEIIKTFKRLRNYIGPQMPLPLMAAATRLWLDDDHVRENRKMYRDKIDLAEKILSPKCDFIRPEAGFFLWLNVGNGEKVCRKLWSECALRVLPGAYISKADENGINPGDQYIRVALVHDLATTDEALSRLVKVL